MEKQAVLAGRAPTAPLDKLAQVGKTVKHPLLNRAKNKYLGTELASQLYEYSQSINGQLTKSYYDSCFCSNTLIQQGNTVVAKYCKQRWCMICNRIRTANLINGYEEPLINLENKYFVTLTVPNVKQKHLSRAISKMLAELKRIQEMFKKRKTPINGIRKLECTYNAETGLYHPHLHLIVQNKWTAITIDYEWRQRFKACAINAQDIRKADDKAVKELFKYFTKLITKVDGKVSVDIPALNTIFTAMKARRVFQPLGNIKKVSEEIEEIQSQDYDIEEAHTIHTWEQDSHDWYDIETGESLTSFYPDYSQRKIFEAIRGEPKPPPEIYLN